MSEKQDVDKLELLISSGKKLEEVGEKVMADGKVDWKDIQYGPEFMKAGIDFVRSLKEYKEIMAEVKDIDAMELAKIGGMFVGK